MTNERQSNAFSIRNHQSITENTGTSSALKIEKKLTSFCGASAPFACSVLYTFVSLWHFHTEFLQMKAK